MIILRARLLSQQIAANVCRTFSTEKTSTPKYWHAKFPDKKPRSFDEMPTVEEPNALIPRKVSNRPLSVKRLKPKSSICGRALECPSGRIDTVKCDFKPYRRKVEVQVQCFSNLSKGIGKY
ncbi:hypothetical protein AVEN_75830-1 [Araneus ventricosus]|uniref:Uncharacterized protein n=1 Tax=Araneus ventricosus TaxID=182803 RepID=A0A4Y2PSZ1_ARAVE|nr:hypothetical protein AVEN_75830-1 [Araneus ventricosus]